MDLGATICTPRRPACGVCPVRPDCRGFAEGCAEALPYRAAKGERPVRRGATFVAVRADGAVLLRERPLHGLLGGMLETPSSPWERGRTRRKIRAAIRAGRGRLAQAARPGRAHFHAFPSRAFRLSRGGRTGCAAKARGGARALPLAQTSRTRGRRAAVGHAEGVAARPRRRSRRQPCGSSFARAASRKASIGVRRPSAS